MIWPVSIFFKAYKLDNESVDTRNNLVTALIKSEQYSKAVEILQSIYRVQKRVTFYLNNMALR